MLSQMLHLFSFPYCRHKMIKIAEIKEIVTYKCSKCEKQKQKQYSSKEGVR